MLYINGNPSGEYLNATGIGVAVAAGLFSLTVEPTDTVTVCTVATVDGEPHESCDDATTIPVIPQPGIDLVNAAGPLVDEVTCAVFRILYPLNVPGVVEIQPEGDVYVLSDLFWDCPPYEFESDGGLVDESPLVMYLLPVV